MTRSYGSGRGPDWQRKQQQPALQQSEPQPELQESEDLGEWVYDVAPEQPDEPSPERRVGQIDFNRRLVAMIIDMVCAYFASAIIAVLPFVNAFLTHTLVLTVFLLVKDFFFEGRGIGKNLMGLQVVNARTDEPCSLMQSIKRNIIILGPLLFLQAIMVALQIFNAITTGAAGNPTVTAVVRWLNDSIPLIVNGVGGAYVLVVLPYEAYRVYNRKDGRRFGDQFAGTKVIEAPMDFSRPIPRE